MRVVTLIDGEHHPDVVRNALDRLRQEHDVLGVLFVGGEEKVPAEVLADSLSHYGMQVTAGRGEPHQALRELVLGASAEAVIDLSGDPVLDGDERFRLASVALHLGLEYRAPGVVLAPPHFESLPFGGPVVAVIGTGKRVGKTAVAGHFAALLRERMLEPVIVAMGRGGPPVPQVSRAGDRPGLAALLAIARGGGHAASDYLEDAVLAGVSCVGTRRCGDGFAGETFDSNVLEGANLALTLSPDVLLLEGSGSALPPIEPDATVCVTSAAAPRQALAYLGPYRLMRANLVAIVGAERLARRELLELKHSLGQWAGAAPLVGCALEPEPAGAIAEGARAAVFTTARTEFERELVDALARRGIDVRVYSSSLARRSELERDLERADQAGCDVYLTELKAAAIEIVADHAQRRGVEVVFLRNRPVSLPGEPDLDAELLRLIEQAKAGVAERQPAEAGRR